MLKIIRNDISNIKRGEVCYTVRDEAATQAKIHACEDRNQAEIDECNQQIEAYSNLKTDMYNKINEANGLLAEANSNNAALSNANINADLGQCTECLEKSISAYQDVLNDCNSQLAHWMDQKAKYQQEKLECKTDEANVVTKTECHYVPDE